MVRPISSKRGNLVIMRFFCPERIAVRSVERPLAVALFAVVALAAGPAAAESFVIDFAPEDGAVWAVATSDHRVEDFGSAGKGSDQTTEIQATHQYEAQSDGSWHVVQEVGDIHMLVGGQELENPMLPIIESHAIRLILDADGTAEDVEGFRSLMRRYERELDTEVYERVRQSMKVARLVEGEVTKWNRALEGLHGLELSPGDVLGMRGLVEIRGGYFEVTGVIEIGEWTEIDGERGVQITCRYDNTGEIQAAAGRLERTVERWMREDATLAQARVRIEGTLDAVVVPSTGQLLSEHYHQTAVAPLTQAPGENASFDTEVRTTWQRVAGSDS